MYVSTQQNRIVIIYIIIHLNFTSAVAIDLVAFIAVEETRLMPSSMFQLIINLSISPSIGLDFPPLRSLPRCLHSPSELLAQQSI
jgi:uncharacterized membrane protein YoaK (UPF0700 family)